MDSSYLAVMKTKLKEASYFWIEGVFEACCFHRVIILFIRSKNLSIRSGQCFLLNGFLFLGSIVLLNSIVIPTLRWMLPDLCSETILQWQCSCSALYSLLRFTFIQLFYVFWFYPLYIFSFILSSLWYNEIARLGFDALGRKVPISTEKSKNEVLIEGSLSSERPAGLGGVMLGIGEQIYSALLFTIFFLEVYAIGFIPYVGKPLNFILLSWMYSYYSFEYKWNLSKVSLDKRLDFFESNWAFFAGFGSPCVLAIFFFSPLVSYGIMAVLFPVFVLTATSSEADVVVLSPRRNWEGKGLMRLPIFYLADIISMRVLSFLKK